MGIEPTQPAWKAGALPLSYARLYCQTRFSGGFTAKNGGEKRIRTSEGIASRFTVCPLWPLGYLPAQITAKLEPAVGIEPTTFRLQGGCSTNELHRRPRNLRPEYDQIYTLPLPEIKFFPDGEHPTCATSHLRVTAPEAAERRLQAVRGTA